MKKLVTSIFLAFTMLVSFVPLTYAATTYKNTTKPVRYTTTTSRVSKSSQAGEVAALVAAVAAIGFILIPIAIGGYVYSSFALMKIAKKLEYDNAWFAWIPILNVILLFKLGDQNPFFLCFVLLPIAGPVIVFVLSVIAYMNLCEKFGRDKLLGLLKISPFGELILLGVLAWHKDSVVAKKK